VTVRAVVLLPGAEPVRAVVLPHAAEPLAHGEAEEAPVRLPKPTLRDLNRKRRMLTP
jgi:hypothetical protein